MVSDGELAVNLTGFLVCKDSFLLTPFKVLLLFLDSLISLGLGVDLHLAYLGFIQLLQIHVFDQIWEGLFLKHFFALLYTFPSGQHYAYAGCLMVSHRFLFILLRWDNLN